MIKYYKAYCKILTELIKEAKRMTVNTRISKSNNKTKTTWNIINELLGKQQAMQAIQKLAIDGTQLTNQQDITIAFFRYFSSVNNSESNSDKLDNVEHDNPSTSSNVEQGKGTPVRPPGY